MSGVVPQRGGYFLFDGALLHGTPEHAWLLEQKSARCLYDDMGDEAKRVGPLLIQATPDSGDLAQCLALGDSALQFASSRLICHQPTSLLDQHLRQLRYLQAGEDQRYYFRFADSRAFHAVWATLDADQQAATLGPIESWEYIHRNGTTIKISAAQNPRGTSMPQLPLALAPTQWHQVLDAARIGELLDATQEALAPQPPGQLAQRHTWTTQTIDWLRRLHIQHPPLLLAANQVMWQTEGLVFKQAVFEAALRDAQRSGNLAQVLSFGKLGARK